MAAHPFDVPLKEADPELHALIVAEKKRQLNCIELIASENFVSKAVQDCLRSCLTNKYAEGYCGSRYYGGTECVDKIEGLCISRALDAFELNPRVWGVNVQPLSGSPANLAVLTAVLQPHDRFMGLGLPEGGHLTHGAYTPNRRISATSVFFESLPYGLDPKTGLIDYEGLAQNARVYRPKLIVCGFSSYPRTLDFEAFRRIADEVKALLWCDMAHFSGLVAGGLKPSPFDFCDIVTSTTHKTLRGPRNGLIFVNKERNPELMAKVDAAVFPGLQGGPHMNAIAGVAHQLKLVRTPEWKEYVQKIIANCKSLCESLKAEGFEVLTGGSDNHLALVDLKPFGLTGPKLQVVCDAVNLTLNKNSIVGDSPATPTGVRLGTPAMTTRGFGEAEFKMVARFLREAVNIAVEVQAKSGKKLVDFKQTLNPNDPKVEGLRERVSALASSFPMPGYPDF